MRVISAALHLEPGSGEFVATFEHQRRERRDIARRPKPEHAGHPARWKGTEPIQHGVEGHCATRDRSHDVECCDCSRIVDRSEEMHRQMEGFGTGPANVRNAGLEVALEPLRRRKSRLIERDGEEAPHHLSAIGAAGALPGCECGSTDDQQQRTDGDQTASCSG